jgi:hypothetical protein
MGAADRPKRNGTPAKRDPTPLPPPKSTKPTGSWAPSKILTKSSGVVKADVRAFLVTCITGWDNYTIDEQRQIIENLPPSRRFQISNPETGKLTCPIDADLVANDPHLKRAVTRFTTDVSNGNYTPSWQEKARQAMKERAEGRFDEYMKQHTEDRFGSDDGSVGTDQTPAPSAQTSRHNDDGPQGQSMHNDSSDGEWNLSAKSAGSRSREQGLKRKTQQTWDRDSSPDPIQPAPKRSRTPTPAALTVLDDHVPPPNLDEPFSETGP